MKENMKCWIVLICTWVCWTTVITMVVSTSTLEEDAFTVLKLGYNTVHFTTSGATKDSYSKFMEDLRRELASDYESHTIPVLRDPLSTPDSERYLLVELTDRAGESITLALDVTNAYVVAYRAGDNSYFFDDAPLNARSNLFQGTTINDLRFRSNYDVIQRVARALREDIDLGMSDLDNAISSLHHTNSDRTRARSLIIAVQMVCEAARFKYIEQRVRASYDRTSGQFQSFRPDASMLSLENNWGALSSEIQESNDGIFSRPVALQRRNFESFNVDRLTKELMLNLALLVFMCKSDKTVSNHSDHYYQQFSPLMLRSMIVDSSNNNKDDDTCNNIPEPTVHVTGRDGKCVDVKGGNYGDGTPIILWPCKSNADINELWILKTDKTIQSNGKCLTTYANWPDSYIMIYNCETAEKNAIIWELDDVGTIKNPHSGLVLSATSGDDGSELTVQNNNNVPYQAWLPTNDTTSNIKMTTIVGYDDLCLHRNGPHTVWIQECDSDKYEQNWGFYQDGTIRPKLNKETCLACEDDTQGSNVVIVDCDPASSRQRWGFRNDGSFYKLATKLVMDVRRSDPSLKQIIMWPYTGNPNQKWLPSYF